MVNWSVFSWFVALAAALLGFSGIAKTLFVIFLVIFLISLFFGRRVV